MSSVLTGANEKIIYFYLKKLLGNIISLILYLKQVLSFKSYLNNFSLIYYFKKISIKNNGGGSKLLITTKTIDKDLRWKTTLKSFEIFYMF